MLVYPAMNTMYMKFMRAWEVAEGLFTRFKEIFQWLPYEISKDDIDSLEVTLAQ